MSGCIWVSSLLLLLLLSSPSLPAMIAISPKWSIMERQIDKKTLGVQKRKEGGRKLLPGPTRGLSGVKCTQGRTRQPFLARHFTLALQGKF